MLAAGITLVLAILCGSATGAAAVSARVRWLPSPDPGIVGYEVYVRSAGQPFQAGIDAGSPPPDGNGIMSYVVDNLGSGTYHFTVLGYAAGGITSTCPGELSLGATSSCVIDQCCLGNCYLETFPNGETCDGDACKVCAAGVCTSAQESALTPDKLALKPRDTRTRMVATGWMEPLGALDPSQSGLTLGVTGTAGNVLLGGVVPAGAMRRVSGTVFVLDRRAGVVGFRSLKARSAQSRTRITARLERFELNPARAESSLGWTMRIGDACARSPDLVCTGTTSHRSCH